MITRGKQPELWDEVRFGRASGYHKGGGDNGAGAQAEAQEKAIALQREQWDQTSANMAPYLNAGKQGISPLLAAITSQGKGLAAQTSAQNSAFSALQNLSSSSGQAQFLSNYFNSPEFNQLAAQGRNQQLASAEATGGLGSTSTNNALAAIAPQLGMQAYQQQMQNQSNLFSLAQGSQQNYLQSLGNLTGIGQAAAGNQAAAGQNYANNTGQLLQGLGSIQAGAAQQPSRAAGALGGAVSGAASGAMIGSAVPGIGTAIGAIGGGVLGLAGSLL